ncbi:MAG: hypothetical protein AAGI63_19520 [Planctomycetota bacterium]
MSFFVIPLRPLRILACCVGFIFAAQGLSGQDANEAFRDARSEELNRVPQLFGGPSSVNGQLAEDQHTREPEVRFQQLQHRFGTWLDFKHRLKDSVDLELSIDESMFYQTATSSLGETQAAGGLVRVYGQWALHDEGTENSGRLIFKIENRHRMGTEITPFDLGFESGSILPTGTFFNQFNFGVTNLFWKQSFFEGDMMIAIGKLDVTDFVDVYALLNPLMHFINLAFSTNPTIAVPNQGLGLGVVRK